MPGLEGGEVVVAAVGGGILRGALLLIASRILELSVAVIRVGIGGGDGRQLVGGRGATSEGRGGERAALVGELLWAGTRVRALKQTTLVAQLGNSEYEVKTKNKRHTTLPGLRLDLRQVEVSVVQQLKHLRRTRSLSFVAASSVWTMVTGCEPGTG